MEPLGNDRSARPGGSSCRGGDRGLPVSPLEFFDLVGGVLGDPASDVGEPGLRIDIVNLGRDDWAVHGGGALAAAFRAAKKPGLGVQRGAASRALGGVVAEADPSVIQEALEQGRALEPVVQGSGHTVSRRESGPVRVRPYLGVGDERRAARLALAGKARGGRGPLRRHLGRQFIFGGRCLQIFELKLHLIEQPRRGLRVRATRSGASTS